MTPVAPPSPLVVPPADDGSCVVSSIVAISKSMRVLLGIKLAELDLLPGQDEMLLVLSPASTLPVKLVADALNIRPSTVSKMADRMVALNFVERVTTERDARQSFLRLTRAGYRMRERVQTVRAELVAEFEAQADADGLKLSAADLDALALMLRRWLHRLR